MTLKEATEKANKLKSNYREMNKLEDENFDLYDELEVFIKNSIDTENEAILEESGLTLTFLRKYKFESTEF